MARSFITDIKVQLEFPASLVCAGKVPKDKKYCKSCKDSTPKPLKSCGSKSLSSKERNFN